jgi:hypothetical protein
MTITSTRRAFVVAALVALPLVSAAPSVAAAEPPNTSTGGAAPATRAAWAAQQQSYLDSLHRAAGEPPAATHAPAAWAAHQRSYTNHLALAAARSRGGDPAYELALLTSSGDTGDGVPLSVAAFMTLAGMALGTGVAVAARRLPQPLGQRVAA